MTPDRRLVRDRPDTDKSVRVVGIKPQHIRLYGIGRGTGKYRKIKILSKDRIILGCARFQGETGLGLVKVAADCFRACWDLWDGQFFS